MVMGIAPRGTHFLIKKEAFVGPLGPFLEGIGQLKVDRAVADRAAITDALAVLDRGGVLGIFPEGTRGDGDFASLRAGLAYFAVRSGAPVVPVAVLGSTAAPGPVDKGAAAAAHAGSTSSSASPFEARRRQRAPHPQARWTRPPSASRTGSPATWRTPGA